MRRPSGYLAMAGLLLLTALVPLPATAGDGAEAVDQAWLRAMRANDIEGTVRTYADNAVAWLPGTGELRGTAAIRAAYQDMLGTNTVTAVSLTDTNYRSAGRLSAGWGHFSLTLTPKAGGAANVLSGRFTTIAERQHGRWVYVVDHASLEPPAPPAQASD